MSLRAAWYVMVVELLSSRERALGPLYVPPKVEGR